MPPQIKFSTTFAENTIVSVEVNKHVYKLQKSSFDFDFANVVDNNKDQFLDFEMVLNITAPSVSGNIAPSGVIGAIDRLFKIKASVDRWSNLLAEQPVQFTYIPSNSGIQYKTTVTKFDIAIPSMINQIDVMNGINGVVINATVQVPMISGQTNITASSFINHVIPYNFGQDTETASLYTAIYERLPHNTGTGFTIPSGLFMFASTDINYVGAENFTISDVNLLNGLESNFGNTDAPLVVKSAVWAHSGHYDVSLVGFGALTIPSTRFTTFADAANLPLTSGNYVLRYTATSLDFDSMYLGVSPKLRNSTLHVVVVCRNNGSTVWEVRPFIYDVYNTTSNRVVGRSTIIDAAYSQPRAIYLGSLKSSLRNNLNSYSSSTVSSLYKYGYVGLDVRAINQASGTIDFDVVYLMGSTDETNSIIAIDQLQQIPNNPSLYGTFQREGINLIFESDVYNRRDPKVHFLYPTFTSQSIPADYVGFAKLQGRGKQAFIALAMPFANRWTFSYPALRAGARTTLYRYFTKNLPI
jgi:hypothetical protein